MPEPMGLSIEPPKAIHVVVELVQAAITRAQAWGAVVAIVVAMAPPRKRAYLGANNRFAH